MLNKQTTVRKKGGMQKSVIFILTLLLFGVAYLFTKPNGDGYESKEEADLDNKSKGAGVAIRVAESKPEKETKKPLIRPLLDLSKIKQQLPTGMPHDLLQGDIIPKDATLDWNLGPTGVRGWMYTDKLDTSQARQIYVLRVAQGSPAEGKLLPKDIILGVEEKLFSSDPRIELGKAIGVVEGDDAKLSFIISRKGKVSRVELQLKIMGYYSKTAPFSCGKSNLILKQGCERIAESLKQGKNKGHWIVRSMNALALLASGDKKYIPLVKAEVKKACIENLKSGYHSWSYGPANMLIAEYILATGDKSFMKYLERITQEIIDGQSVAGSWGHKFIASDGRLGGYGMMNVVGLPICTSLILAKKAGAKNLGLDETIRKTTRMFRFYVGKGSIGYSDGSLWTQTHDDNGKNGIAAVMFNIFGDKEASTYFSRMSLATHGNEREQGHTGNFFNMLWAMPAVALNGPNATGAWLEEFGWYYDLARQWDGSFIHQGSANSRKDKYKDWDSTGAYMLAYAQALKKTNITGRNVLLSSVTRKEALSVINDGRGWSKRLGLEALKKRTSNELLTGLQSWSPVVRERSATLLAERGGDYSQQLILMLKEGDLYSQLGACLACAKLSKKAGAVVGSLIEKLDAKDPWLRIKAVEALSAIGEPAKKAVPQMLVMLTENNPQDPRQMLQRYISLALFNRGGILSRSLNGVPYDELIKAVKIGLQNEDGRARGALSSVYRNLKYEQLKPLLPAIKKAIDDPSPKGIMFNAIIQVSGLELFAKHKIEEGLRMAVHFIRHQKDHGSGKRTEQVMKIIGKYGIHAKKYISKLESYAVEFAGDKRKSVRKKADMIRAGIKKISALTEKPELIHVRFEK